MKTIGLIGGMSWESTVTYYQVINETVKKKLGGLHSAQCILYSVDFAEIEHCQAVGDWQRSAEILTEAGLALERAGADFIVICTNTMHKVVPEMRKTLTIPILHIAEMTAQALDDQHIHRVGLLGTKYTMQQDFYKSVLQEQGIDVLIPEEKQMELVNHVIYDELCKGVISADSKQDFLDIIEGLAQRGVQGIILGCTEIGLLVQQDDSTMPLFDTALIHAERAALEALR
ncbi:MAG: aspartate/glutamate racemase family protein [Peptococcaceae bacterium]|nr:aspartate/glutamate racemase family protein [Peptococcaceae bacterium]